MILQYTFGIDLHNLAFLEEYHYPIIRELKKIMWHEFIHGCLLDFFHIPCKIMILLKVYPEAKTFSSGGRTLAIRNRNTKRDLFALILNTFYDILYEFGRSDYRWVKEKMIALTHDIFFWNRLQDHDFEKSFEEITGKYLEEENFEEETYRFRQFNFNLQWVKKDQRKENSPGR